MVIIQNHNNLFSSLLFLHSPFFNTNCLPRYFIAQYYSLSFWNSTHCQLSFFICHSSLFILHLPFLTLYLKPPLVTLHPSTFSLAEEVGVWHLRNPSCLCLFLKCNVSIRSLENNLFSLQSNSLKSIAVGIVFWIIYFIKSPLHNEISFLIVMKHLFNVNLCFISLISFRKWSILLNWTSIRKVVIQTNEPCLFSLLPKQPYLTDFYSNNPFINIMCSEKYEIINFFVIF
jgi:hypothetical protein